MSRRLHHFKLGSLCTIKHGYPFDGSKFENQGNYIVLTPGNFLKRAALSVLVEKKNTILVAFHKNICVQKMT